MSRAEILASRIGDIPPLPQVAVKVLELYRDPDTSVQEMHGRVVTEAFGRPDLVPEIARVDTYPEEWRTPEEESADESNWDELRDRLKAMGYVN